MIKRQRSIKRLAKAIWLSHSLLIAVSAFADLKAIPPLTISDQQAAKLQQIFPATVTQTDLANADNGNVQHRVWNKVPINVSLPVGRERLLSFPEAVQFGYDKSVLTPDLLSVQNVNQTLYLVAQQPFESQRVYVQLKQSGELILLNLSALPNADDTPLAIVLPKADTKLTNANPNPAPVNETVSETELTRFAIQQLYAPKRLLSNPDGITRIPLHTARTVPLVSGDSVIAMPLIAWRSADSFVTAVTLRNRLNHPVTLDPRRLRGQWRTAAFFPQTRLQASGSARDSTTVFLISDQPFVDALAGAN